MASLQEQMSGIDAQIRANNSVISSSTDSENQWRIQSQVGCSQTLKKKREECQADKQVKAGKADSHAATIAGKKNENAALLKSKQSLEALILAEAESQVKLAAQGKDSTSIRIEATGQADAARTAAENISQAQARSIEVASNADAEGKKKEKNVQLIIIISVAGLFIAILGFVLVKKFIKKKK